MGFPTIRRRIHFAMNKLFTLVLIALFSFSAYVHPVFAVTGVPEILSHQGRLLDTSGNLLGGSSGTNYCFRFSFYDDATVGGGDTKLWPMGTPSTMTVQVKSGVFNVGIGDTSAGGDALDFDFESNDSAYLNTEVAAQVAGSCAGVSFENLSPRQRITSSGFAVNASTLNGRTSSQSATGDDVVALTSDDLILGGTSVDIGTTGANTLTLQGNGATGAVQFFSSSNSLSSTGNLDVAGTLQSGSSNVALTLATGFVDADAITLTASGTTGATSSNSGLEAIGDGLTLLKGCSDGQILKYTDAGGWACAADASGGGLSDADYGDITVSSSGSVWTVDNGVITSAKIFDGTIANADLAAGTFSNVTGTGALGAGSITSGFGAIDIGADNFTTTGVVNTDALTLTNTGTLNGLDVLDATSETTIEGAIDTLANLTSIQGNSFTVAGSTTISGTNTGDQTSVTGNAGTVTFADAGGDTTTFVALGTSATGSLAPATDAGLSYNATTNALTATTFIGGLTGNVTGDVTGNLTGNVTGNVSGSSGSTTGNAATATALAANPTDCGANAFATTIAANGNLTCASITDVDVPNSITVDLAAAATALATPRNINGVAFDGTADITVAAAAGTLTGTTLAANVVTSSLTTVGALDAGSITSGFGAIDTGTDNITTTGTVSTNTLTLTGTGTLNGLDVIDATGEATLEAALDIAGDVTGTGLSAVVIADNAVDGTDIALGSDAQGDVMYYDGTNWVRLAAGNAGEVLQTGGAGANPSWVAAAAGDILAVGDVASGAAFNGAAGTTLTFDDSDGDQTFAYDTTNNEFDISDDVSIAGVLAATGGVTIDAITESNIESAVDIAGDVDGTGLGAVDLDEVAVESELESVIDLADLQGAVTDVQVPNTITIDLASTASALAANAANCSAGSGAGGVSAAGAAEDCTDYEEDLSNSAGLRAALSDETGTGLAVFNDSPTFADDLDLAAAGVRLGAADGVLTMLGLGNGADEDLSFDFDNAGANTVAISSSTGVTSMTFGGIALTTDTLTLTGTGTLNGVDAIDGATESTFEAALDIAGDVTGTGLSAVVIADNAVDGTDIALGSDAQGDVMYYDGTNWVRLAAGNSGEFLQTGGTGANPSWVAAAAGDITAVGNVASGAAFTGTAGTILTFDDADGDQTFAYDTTNNEFDISDDVSIAGTLAASGGLTIDTTTESNIEAAVDIAGDIDGTGLAAVDLDEVAVESELESVIDLADLQGAVTDVQVPNTITIDSATTAGTVTFADAGGDTTTFVALGTSATGSLAPATDAGLSYNATTNALTATTFIGGLTGNVTGDVTGNLTGNVTGNVSGSSGSTTGNAATATALAANPTDCGANAFATSIAANGNLTCASIVDADVPNDITVDLATLASTVTVVDSTDATSFIGIYDSATGSLAPKTDAALTYNATTGAVTATSFVGALTGAATDLNCTDCIGATEITDLALGTDTTGNYVATISGGAGLTGSGAAEGSTPTLAVVSGNGAIVVNADDITLTVAPSGDGLSATTSSGSGLEVLASGLGLLQGCADGEVLKWNEASDIWACAADSGGSFDSTTVDDTTWSDGANASNVWTFDVSGTDHTVTFGNGLVTFSHDVTVTGVIATTGGLTIDATTETNIETALDTLSNVTTVGALNAGSITSGFGSIDVGSGDTIATDTINGASATTLAVGDATSTGLSLCNSAACDTITIGSNADADTITIGDSTDTGVSITDNNWSIGTTGIATFVNALVSPSATTGIDTGSAGALSVGNTTATSTSICNSANCDIITIGTTADNDTITIGEATDQNVSITDNNWSISVAGLVTTSGGLNVTAGDIGLADTTGTTWSITSGGVLTLAGGGDGVNNIVLTTGDIQLSDGDFDMSGGDFNVTLDNADTASFTTNSAAAVDGLSVTLAGTADAAGIDGLFINATASNQTNQTVNALNISLAAGGTASGDIARGIFLDLASVGNAANTTKAIEIENTAAWDTDIELQNDESIDNAVDGVIGLSATTVDISGALEAGSSDVALTLGTGFIDADSMTLVSATDGLTGTTSASGLAVHSDGLTLLQGCSDAQVLSWVESTDTWDCTTNSATLANGDKGDITIASGGASMTVDFSTSDGAGSASSAAGIEEGTGGIALLQGCSDQQILKWTEGTSLWECAADSNTGSISADSLNFSEFADALVIDAATEINLGAFAFTIDLDSSGDFSVRDGSTDIATFVDSGAITFAPTAGQAFSVEQAAGTGFNVAATAAPTVDQIALTNAGFGTTTAGVDGMSIDFVTGDGASNTNSALDITLTNGGTAAGDVMRGITLNSITPTAGTETGMYIGTGYDSDLEFADSSATVQLTDRGTLSIVDGASGVGTLLAVGSSASRGDLDVYGQIKTIGSTDQEAITAVNDVFVYDTTRDRDGGAWTNSPLSQAMSWYTETKDDGAGDACAVATDDRCGKSEFPKKAILVAADSSLSIFDADSKSLWMKFVQTATTEALGADTNNNPSSVFAMNGVVYVGTNGGSATGMYAFDFTQDTMFRYNTTDRSQANLAIGSRNSATTYATNSITRLQINSNAVNDVHANVVYGSPHILTVTIAGGGPLQGQTFIAAATDDGISVINPQAKITWDFGNGAVTDNYNSVYLTKRARLYGLNATDVQVNRWGIPATTGGYADTATANVTAVTKTFAGNSGVAALAKTAPTIGTAAPDALEVVERASMAEIDPPATAGMGDVIYVGHSLGLTEIHDTNVASASGAQPWSKHYTTTYETPYMFGSIKNVYTFEEASGDIVDKSFSANNLDAKGGPTYLADGVHNAGVALDGATEFFCNDTTTPAGTDCDADTDWNTTNTAFHIQMWFKHATSVTGTDALFEKCYTPATPTATACTVIWMDANGLMNFATDDDATWTSMSAGTYDDVATSVAGRSYADGQWHHLLAYRANGTTGVMQLFIDGQLVGGRTIAGGGLTLDASQTVTIGATCSGANCATGANFWEGSIDDFAMTAGGATTLDAITQAQVRKMYLEGYNAMKRKTMFDTDATAATTTSVDYSASTWVPNEFVGEIIEFTGSNDNDCIGVTRVITSNDANTLNFAAVPGNCTMDTSLDYEVNPETLYGSSNIVTSIAAEDPAMYGTNRNLYVGTDNTSDGGGVTVFSGYGTPSAVGVYHGMAGKSDTSGSAWDTTADYDDISSIDMKSGVLVIGSQGKIWSETSDRNLTQSIDKLANDMDNMRLELLGDNATHTSFEFGSVGGADLAEYYYSNSPLEPGDVVAIQPDQPAGINKSALAYQSNLLGVVSTAPGLILGPVAENAYAVALAGRIPVKITNENGSIHVGDKLTSATKAGYAMKATKAGAVIGTVINEPELMTSCDAPLPSVEESVGDGPGVENVDPSMLLPDAGLEGQGDDTEIADLDQSDDDELCGYAVLFIGMSDSLGENIDRLTSQYVDGDFVDTEIGGLEIEIAADDVLIAEKHIMAFLEATRNSYTEDTELESIFTDKLAAAVEIIAPSIYTKGLTVDSVSSLGDAISFMNDVVFIGRPYFNADTAGFAVILEGAQKVDISFTTPYLTQPVVSADVSLENDADDFSLEEALFAADVDYIVTKKSVNGFTILLNKPAPQDIKFSWIALAVNEAVTTEGAPTGNETAPSVPEEPVPEPETVPAPVPDEEVPLSDEEPVPESPAEPVTDTAGETVDESVLPDDGTGETLPEDNNPPVEQSAPPDGMETDTGVI